jgi:hypothetical protein
VKSYTSKQIGKRNNVIKIQIKLMEKYAREEEEEAAAAYVVQLEEFVLVLIANFEQTERRFAVVALEVLLVEQLVELDRDVLVLHNAVAKVLLHVHFHRHVRIEGDVEQIAVEEDHRAPPAFNLAVSYRRV